MTMCIETPRLLLRQWQAIDYSLFAALNADPKVMQYFPTLLTHSESDAMIDRCRQLIAERGLGFWAVELKETGQFIGMTGLHIPVAELPFSPCVEIGWRLAFNYWGYGYATEAANAALTVGFEQLDLAEVVAFTALKNERSQAVMRRLGMSYEKNFEHPAVPNDSLLKQHCLYKLTKIDWLHNH